MAGDLKPQPDDSISTRQEFRELAKELFTRESTENAL
jgi:hypothetical protein